VWSRAKLLNFVLIGPYFLLLGLLGFLILGLPYIFLHTLSPRIAGNLANIAGVLETVLLICTAVFILGGQRISLFRDSLRLPGLQSLLIAATLPVAICGLVPFSWYVIDRADWAAHSFARFSPPQFSSYFDFENTFQSFALVTILRRSLRK